MEKIAIIRIEDDSSEPNACFRIDDAAGGTVFFSNLQAYDEGNKPNLSFEFVTLEEWAEIERVGREEM